MRPSKTQLPPKLINKKVENTYVNPLNIVFDFYDHYQKYTPQSLKIIDFFIVFLIVSGFLQFLYCFIVGTYPFNSFLSGVFSVVGQIGVVSLRYEVNYENTESFKKVPLKRAFGDFVFSSIILHFFVINFLG
ncbi:dolichyl-diphosphooligosaccharide-protein glycotransferase [Pneumocystis jirovecii RU7]|uniref:Dolichyl-diphosphooligosaccharide--protein glycosyltransferase subunit OST2 n=1 Tax=Pneumocystis jirovecii (strain RU7) TaxID=1408657 RepID=A0A0W4ZTZ5_PNEJ7|nr:dolichyl-diphosphooligosaccharide-protein glycotransferase [Pneumocystis jirovecii RU7]KTW31796.1 hypothetical protein T551_01057 [Pneumocystis jirovecii RU7]